MVPLFRANRAKPSNNQNHLLYKDQTVQRFCIQEPTSFSLFHLDFVQIFIITEVHWFDLSTPNEGRWKINRFSQHEIITRLTRQHFHFAGNSTVLHCQSLKVRVCAKVTQWSNAWDKRVLYNQGMIKILRNCIRENLPNPQKCSMQYACSIIRLLVFL